MPGKKNNLKPGKLKRVDAIADRISQMTKFNVSEARCLVLIHHRMECLGVLDVRRFREFLQIVFDITDEIMLDFLFHHFDADHSGHIDEFEFCEGMSVMTRGSIDELADFSYSIYDINGDGSLAREEVHHCIKGCIFPGFGVDEDEVEECEREITDIVMKKLDMDRDGLITVEDFRAAARKNPLLLNGLGACLPSGQCKGAFLGTFSERHRRYSPDFPNVLDAIQKMDHRYNRHRNPALRGNKPPVVMSSMARMSRTASMMGFSRESLAGGVGHSQPEMLKMTNNIRQSISLKHGEGATAPPLPSNLHVRESVMAV